MNYMQLGFFLAAAALIIASIACFRSTHSAAKSWMLGFLVLSLFSQAVGYLPFLLLQREAMSVVDYGRILETTSIASRILEVFAWLCLLRFVLVMRDHGKQVLSSSSGLPAPGPIDADGNSQSAQPAQRAGERTITTVCAAVGAGAFVVLNLVTQGAVPGGIKGALAGIVLGWGVGWVINVIRRPVLAA